MKTILKITTLFLLIFTATLIIVSCDKDDDTKTPEESKPTLSNSDIEGLVFMREEEKLARDSYLTLYQLWGDQVFNNIAKSEQTHMDLLYQRMEKYGITDKDVILPDTGKFTNKDLQNLYNQLMAQGKDSTIAAFIVGATIEEVDIVDLAKYIDKTDNEDLKCTYTVLTTGSRNHLRAFVRSMNNRGYSYSPQYLSQDDYDKIINGSHEKAPSCD